MKQNKYLFIMSGPSGAGKSSITKYVSNLTHIPLMISATSRKPRLGEENGKDYYFLTKEEFEKNIENDLMMEYEKIYDNYYGTLKSKVDEALDNNKSVILEIDAKGAMNIYSKYKNIYNIVLVFCKTKSIQVLIDRITKRSAISEEELEKRVDRVKLELKFAKYYHYTIVNDDFNKSCNEFYEIIKKTLGE